MDNNSQQQEFLQLLESFLNDTVVKINVDASTPEKDAILRELIKEKINRRIFALIVEELSDEQFQELVAGLDEENLTEDQEEALLSQVASEIPDFPEKFARALEEVQTNLIADIDDLRQLAAKAEK